MIHDGQKHWTGCESVHAYCAVIHLRRAIAAMLAGMPGAHHEAGRLLVATKGWEAPETDRSNT